MVIQAHGDVTLLTISTGVAQGDTVGHACGDGHAVAVGHVGHVGHGVHLGGFGRYPPGSSAKATVAKANTKSISITALRIGWVFMGVLLSG